MKLLADTSALLAMSLRDERNHRPAARFVHENPKTRFVMTELVLDEYITHLRSRIGASRAVGAARKFLASERYELIFVDIDLLQAALVQMERYKDKEISLTDCVSFELMERLRLDAAFAFDTDFHDCGFRMFP